jgi:hypothetical protein
VTPGLRDPQCTCRTRAPVTSPRLHADECEIQWHAAREVLAGELADQAGPDVVVPARVLRAYLAATACPPMSVHAWTQAARAATGLALIQETPGGGRWCHRFTDPGECTRQSHGLRADAEDREGRWCDACIAWAAVTGLAPLPGLDPADPQTRPRLDPEPEDPRISAAEDTHHHPDPADAPAGWEPR